MPPSLDGEGEKGSAAAATGSSRVYRMHRVPVNIVSFPPVSTGKRQTRGCPWLTFSRVGLPCKGKRDRCTGQVCGKHKLHGRYSMVNTYVHVFGCTCRTPPIWGFGGRAQGFGELQVAGCRSACSKCSKCAGKKGLHIPKRDDLIIIANAYTMTDLSKSTLSGDVIRCRQTDVDMTCKIDT